MNKRQHAVSVMQLVWLSWLGLVDTMWANSFAMQLEALSCERRYLQHEAVVVMKRTSCQKYVAVQYPLCVMLSIDSSVAATGTRQIEFYVQIVLCI